MFVSLSRRTDDDGDQENIDLAFRNTLSSNLSEASTVSAHCASEEECQNVQINGSFGGHRDFVGVEKEDASVIAVEGDVGDIIESSSSGNSAKTASTCAGAAADTYAVTDTDAAENDRTPNVGDYARLERSSLWERRREEKLKLKKESEVNRYRNSSRSRIRRSVTDEFIFLSDSAAADEKEQEEGEEEEPIRRNVHLLIQSLADSPTDGTPGRTFIDPATPTTTTTVDNATTSTSTLGTFPAYSPRKAKKKLRFGNGNVNVNDGDQQTFCVALEAPPVSCSDDVLHFIDGRIALREKEMMASKDNQHHPAKRARLAELIVSKINHLNMMIKIEEKKLRSLQDA